MSTEKKQDGNLREIVKVIGAVLSPEVIQQYVFGYKKSGKPRAFYDIVKDQTVKKDSGKKGKKGKRKPDKFSLYLGDSKRKKKKKKSKTWRYDD